MTKRDTLIALLMSLTLAAILVPYAITGVDMHHDGIMLKPALDVLSGQVLFRDSFMQYGALTCYLQVAALAITPRLLTLKLLVVGIYAFTLFVLYVSWREILPRILTICACAMFILFIPHYERSWLGDYWIFPIWSSAFAMLFQSIVLLALFRIIRNQQPLRWAATLGVACACVWWCRQPVGIATAGCLVIVAAALSFAGWTPQTVSKSAIVKHAFLGFATVTLVLAGSIALSGAGPEWLYQNYIWPKNWAIKNVQLGWDQIATEFVHPFSCFILALLLLAAVLPTYLRKPGPTIKPWSMVCYWILLSGLIVWKYPSVVDSVHLRRGGWTLLIPAFIVIQALFGFAGIFRKRPPENNAEYFLVSSLSALALSALTQYYPIADAWHVFWSISPAFGLFVFIFWRWSKWSPTAVTIVLSLLLAPSAWYKIDSARQFRTQSLAAVTKPEVLQGMRVPPRQADNFLEISELLETIESHRPNCPTALIGNDAIYLCFGRNRQNPSPYFVTWAGLADDDHSQRRWNYIQHVRPLLFVHKPNWAAVDDYYAKAGYVPVLYIEEEAFEIAAPGELAKSAGLSAVHFRHAKP